MAVDLTDRRVAYYTCRFASCALVLSEIMMVGVAHLACFA
jgi:hypothetical protein